MASLSKLSVRARGLRASNAIILLSAACPITHCSVTFQQIIGIILNFNGSCWSLHHFQACSVKSLSWPAHAAGAKVMGRVLLVGWLVRWLSMCVIHQKSCALNPKAARLLWSIANKSENFGFLAEVVQVFFLWDTSCLGRYKAADLFFRCLHSVAQKK